MYFSMRMSSATNGALHVQRLQVDEMRKACSATAVAAPNPTATAAATIGPDVQAEQEGEQRVSESWRFFWCLIFFFCYIFFHAAWNAVDKACGDEMFQRTCRECRV
jgi:hypothetical protein